MAARTLAQLRAAVEGLGYGVDLATTQNQWINDDYQELAGERRWKWLEASASLTTTAGTSAYSLASAAPDLRNLDVVRVADASGIEMRFDAKPTNWVRDRLHRYNQTSDRAAPRFWAFFAGQLQIYPIPDGVYTVTIDYTKSAPDLVGDTDVPLLPEAFDSILVWGAIARAATRQNNWLTRDYAEGKRSAVLARMQAQDEMQQRQNADEVEWTGMWDQPWP